MRRLFLNRSEPAKRSGQNIPKNRCRTTVAERMMETLAELPFYRGLGRLLKPRTRPPAAERDPQLTRRPAAMRDVLSQNRHRGRRRSCKSRSHDQAAAADLQPLHARLAAARRLVR